MAFARFAVIAPGPGKFSCSGVGVAPTLQIEHFGQAAVAYRIGFHCGNDGGDLVADGDSVDRHEIAGKLGVEKPQGAPDVDDVFDGVFQRLRRRSNVDFVHIGVATVAPVHALFEQGDVG